MTLSDALKRDNNNLDLFRIILSYLVIIGHSTFINGNKSFWIDPISYLFPFTYSGAFAVKLFFVISGFVVANSLFSKQKPIEFIFSRFFRIVPALAFVLLTTYILIGPKVSTLNLHQYFSDTKGLFYICENLIFKTHQFLPGVFEHNLISKTVNGSLWTLSYEVKCYIALLIVYFLTNKHRKIGIITFLASTTIFTLLIIYSKLNWHQSNSEIYLLPFSFALGVTLATFAKQIKISGIIACLLILIYIIAHKSIYNEVILIIVASYTLLYLSSTKTLLKIKPRYDISYGVYLWGFIIQQCLYHYLGTIQTALHCIIALTLASIMGLISFIFIERPAIKLGKEVSAKFS